MFKGIATITTSTRAELVRVSPILAKIILGGQTYTLRVFWHGEVTVWAVVGEIVLSVVTQISCRHFDISSHCTTAKIVIHF